MSFHSRFLAFVERIWATPDSHKTPAPKHHKNATLTPPQATKPFPLRVIESIGQKCSQKNLGKKRTKNSSLQMRLESTITRSRTRKLPGDTLRLLQSFLLKKVVRKNGDKKWMFIKTSDSSAFLIQFYICKIHVSSKNWCKFV